jgi:hypothetical protein
MKKDGKPAAGFAVRRKKTGACPAGRAGLIEVTRRPYGAAVSACISAPQTSCASCFAQALRPQAGQL